jgi:hypothetical protein
MSSEKCNFFCIVGQLARRAASAITTVTAMEMVLGEMRVKKAAYGF